MAFNRSVQRAQELVTYPCTLCDSEDGVKWFCNDCQENLCDRCKDVHTRGRKTWNDDIVAIQKATRKPEKPVPDVCKLHPVKLCDFFCSDCEELVCLMCISKTHKQHNWKHFEDEFSSKKQQLKAYMTDITTKIDHFRNETSERHCDNEGYNDNIDTVRKEVNSQRTKLKAEVDSIADAILAELLALEKEESAMHKKDCQRSEEKVEELTRLLEQAERTNTSSVSLFETEKSLRKKLPLYDVNVEYVSPQQPSFVTGSIDRIMLSKSFGELNYKKDISCKQVQRLSKFTVTPQVKIYGICPVDESHVWLSIEQYQGLDLVNMDGVVIATVQLNFSPCRLAMSRTTDTLYMNNRLTSVFVYKLSLQNRQVTKFANIRPHNAYDISINDRDEVFVSTHTPDIVVLNQSGMVVRKVRIGSEPIRYVVCLSSGGLCVVQTFGVSLANRKILITDESGTLIQTWTGELENDQKVGNSNLLKMIGDKYDRIFVPDSSNNQVYVLPRDSTQATCILDQNHGVIEPTSVGVDTRGKVWIGCKDGTVHVMRL